MISLSSAEYVYREGSRLSHSLSELLHEKIYLWMYVNFACQDQTMGMDRRSLDFVDL